MRRSTIAGISVAAILLAGSAAWMVVNRGDDVEAGPVAVDLPLPVLEGESLEGAPLSTREARGHVLVINVWATWCGPCARELPGIERAAARYAGEGVRFLGLNYRDDRAAARGWQDERFKLSYPSLYDPRGQFAHDLKFPYLPDTYVVDASGTIRWEIIGETNEQELSGLIDQVLEPSANVSSA